MPNGHGGIPKYGSPVVLFIVLLILVWLRLARNILWPVLAAYPIVIILGWRLAWHIHMYDATEYGGAYTPKEEIESAKRKYRIGIIVYIFIGLLISSSLWFLRSG